jgi:hypothetical protein
MDIAKYPLEKLWQFVAGVIPGATALIIFERSSVGRFHWFLASDAIGYRTKVAVVVGVCFVLGNSLTEVANRLLAAIGGAIGGVIGSRTYKPSFEYETGPWRDPKWRAAVKRQLGDAAPPDVPLVPEITADWVKSADELMASMQNRPPTDFAQQRIVAVNADMEWKNWYEHYHQLVLEPDDRDFVLHVRNGFNMNMEIASMYLLASMLFVPAARQWWCVVISLGWLAISGLEVAAGFMRYINKFSTLDRQILYLNRIE